MENKKVLLKVKNLKKWFPVKRGLPFAPKLYIKAVDDVSLEVYEGETLGLVGESGCGKSTLARTMLRLLEPTSGEIEFNGEDLLKAGPRELRAMRRHMQIVFQDPFGSLHPKMRVRTILEEPLIISKFADRKGRAARVEELIDLVGLKPEHLRRYPHEFSGGQRQRIAIARALATSPGLVVCDEPVSALDVSVRSQILNLLEELQQKIGLTYLFISHDLSVVEHICDRIAVMYLGKMVELASRDELFNNPLHPYTKALLSAVPRINSEQRQARITLQGDIPSPANPPEGCRFHTRCRFATELCKTMPEIKDVGDGHFVACHYVSRNEEME